MKLTVHNVARVSSAEIELGGITVITGPNGTGKSTISRALMTLCSVSARIPELVQFERLISVVRIVRDACAKFGADVFVHGGPQETSSRLVPIWLSVEWWKDIDSVVKWFQDSRKMESEYGMLVFPRGFGESERCRLALTEARTEVLDALEKTDEMYVEFVCKKAFRRAFRKQLRNVHSGVTDPLVGIDGARNGISIRFNRGGVSKYVGIGVKVFPSTVYFEPLHQVDMLERYYSPEGDRYNAGDLNFGTMLKRRPSSSRLSLEEDEELGRTKEILNDIASVIHGRIADENDGTVSFHERISEREYPIMVTNVASGMKTMAAIVRAVENRSIRRGSMIIVDEPESNLHPEWQVKFAEFLVLLCNRLDVNILLNTHSPYFLQAINVFTAKWDVQRHFYNMSPDGETAFRADPVKDIKSVFADMARPFDDLT